MSTLVDLKSSLEKALEENAQLESRNKKILKETADAQIKRGQLLTEIETLEKKKKGLEAEIKESRAAMLYEIDTRNLKSEEIEKYVQKEKSLVNDLKLRIEEDAKGLESHRKKFEHDVAVFKARVSLFEKALLEAGK